ncbi:hypothetical protein BKA67DRAFT_536242 [Truncatella angustata]|uniref:Uncharacterized protein n=1 Tax=Truncatella angustata TaxID=152316 RepID=A0A9P8ZX03_9PEZI|nr:uncharacterized protein BKA67DRAFT_536242 [Truncatella angustata]KAH6652504.1 hypothetical protein BKA67DRAFT_536242 [Truncatella angustata]
MVKNLNTHQFFKALSLTIEVVLMLVMVTLFCCAYSDHYRTSLWEAGGEKGWNSNPRLRIYYYANHREPPEIPLIWNQSLTTSNLSIALVTAGVCLTRLVLIFFELYWVIIETFYDMLLTALWCYSVSAQSSADLTDSKHPSYYPWYLQRRCCEVNKQYFQACTIARVSFWLSVVLMIFYASRFAVAIFRLAYWCGEHRLADICVEKLHDCVLRYLPPSMCHVAVKFALVVPGMNGEDFLSRPDHGDVRIPLLEPSKEKRQPPEYEVAQDAKITNNFTACSTDGGHIESHGGRSSDSGAI